MTKPLATAWAHARGFLNFSWLPRATPLAALVGALTLSGCVVVPLPHHRLERPVYRSAPAPMAVGPLAVAPVDVAPQYFYPQRSQPEGLQDRDRYECYRWAVAQTGSDPGMTTVRADNAGVAQRGVYLPPRAGAGEVVGGALTGALLGAAVSSPRQAGPNAVIGAIFGAAIGAASGEARNRAIDEAQQREERRQELAAQRARVPVDNFRRAMSACMHGRGYQVE